MKRIGNLYERIISIENLEMADRKARRGKTNTYGVKQHDKNHNHNIYNLHIMLKNKTYKTSEYNIFKIFEPKERLVYRLPYYPDRIVHHAIMNILEPVWLSIFTYNTYSCIKKRGIEGCARQVDKIIKSFKDKKIYCLKIDIKKFYPSIDHEILKKLIRKKIKDRDLLWLLDEIVDSTNGLPIGNYLSQFLANLYLSYFMHYVNEILKIKCVEYADDICFFSEDKKELHNTLYLIKDYLLNELKLEINRNYQIFPISKNKYDNSGRGLDYIGYKFYRKQKLIRKKIKKKFSKKVNKINKKTLNLKEYKQEISPWLGWIKHSNSKHLLKIILKNKYYESIL